MRNKKIRILFIMIILLFIITSNVFAKDATYKINVASSIIYRVLPKTEASDFELSVKQQIANEQDVVELYKGTSKVTSGLVETGMKIFVNSTEAYDVSVLGDVSRDGAYNQVDLSALIRNEIKLSEYIITDKAELKSADVNNDGFVNIIDISATIKYILTTEIPEDVSSGSDNTKQIPTITLSEQNGIVTYPETKTINVTSTSNGALSVQSSNTNIVEATLNGTTITLNPKAIESDTTATITVLSAETDTYTSGSATYVVSVNQGTITVNAQDYSGEYDGQGHSITVTTNPQNATITYSTDGTNFSSTKPTFTNVTSAATVYYKAQLAGYKVATGNNTVTITKRQDAQAPQNATINLSGSNTQSNLPATVKATVTHTDTEETATDLSSGINISACKYKVNDSNSSLGTNPNSYDKTFSSNGQQVSLSLSSTGTYYLHVLSVDVKGNAKETIKGPISISAKYHSHSGNSTSGGGCYGTPNYHVHTGNATTGGGCYGRYFKELYRCPYGYEHTHTDSCYSVGHTHTDECYGGHEYTAYWRQWQCNVCNTNHPCWDYEKTNICPTCGVWTDHRGTADLYCNYCNKTKQSLSISGNLDVCYSHLTCNISTIPVVICEKYEHKHTSSCYEEGYARNCGKTTSTIESYERDCGKTTSTIEYYNVSY